MRLQTPVNTYASQARAERKLSNVHREFVRLSDDAEVRDPRYLIATSPEGRFYPVVIASSVNDPSFYALAGVQIVG